MKRRADSHTGDTQYPRWPRVPVKRQAVLAALAVVSSPCTVTAKDIEPEQDLPSEVVAPREVAPPSELEPASEVLAQSGEVLAREEVRIGKLEQRRANERIVTVAHAVDGERPTVAAHLELSSALYASARFSGARDQLDWAVSEASACVELDPAAHECLLARARGEVALALYPQAREDAAKARQSGADELEVSLVLADVDWSEGKYHEAAEAIRAVAAQRPTPENLARRARLEFELGHYPFADYLLGRALTELIGVEPQRRAWLEALRGAQNRELGRLESAEQMLRRALERVPEFPYALAELGRTLVARQQLREATRVYRQLVAHTRDPEYLGELASVLRARGQLEQANGLDGEAKRVFEEGLTKHPEALRLPAARFYLADGRDVGRALRLLQENGRFLGSTELEMCARALLASGRLADAEEAIRGALVLAPVSLRMLQTAEATYRMLAEIAAP